ncbi:hypothetical protein [Okeania sp. SIO3B5]|nr:hypothetical protein [Okeania sp. SIO3B5]
MSLDIVRVKRSLSFSRLMYLLSNSYVEFRYSHSQAIAQFQEINV